MVPVWVRLLSSSRARPKSVSLSWESLLTRMFSGLMSRWTTPARSAATSAWPSWVSHSRAVSGSRVRSERILESELPSTNSMVRKGPTSGSSPTSKTVMMLAWLSWALISDSRWNRAIMVSESERVFCTIFTATRRFRSGSWAR